MGACTSKGFAQYVAAEGHVYAWPRGWQFDQSRRVVLVCRGAGGDHMTNFSAVQGLAGEGMLAISFDQAYTSTATWPAGNDTQLARFDSAWAFAKAQLNCKPDKALLYGGSGGTISALNWARANPTKVAAVAQGIPAVNLTDLHDRDVLSTRSPIEAAYGGAAGWTAAKATKDPYLNIASIPSVPGIFWYSEDDPSAVPSYAHDVATAKGWQWVSTGANGHSTGTYLTDVIRAAFLRLYDA